MLAHVNVVREDLVLLAIDHGECMDWDKYFVSFTVYSDAVVIVLVLIIGGELHIDVF